MERKEKANAFHRAGYNCAVCDIRELKYKDRQLFTPDGLKIDAIYRRAVTCDIMENRASVSDFLAAAENGDVCLIGGMRTQGRFQQIAEILPVMDPLSKIDLCKLSSRQNRHYITDLVILKMKGFCFLMNQYIHTILHGL